MGEEVAIVHIYGLGEEMARIIAQDLERASDRKR
jgi:hypothetical protein